MTTDFALGVGVGITPGVMLGAAMGLWMYRGLVARAAARNALVEAARAMQTHREATDSERDHLPRDGSGEPGEVRELFPPRLGALQRNRLAK